MIPKKHKEACNLLSNELSKIYGLSKNKYEPLLTEVLLTILTLKDEPTNIINKTRVTNDELVDSIILEFASMQMSFELEVLLDKLKTETKYIIIGNILNDLLRKYYFPK